MAAWQALVKSQLPYIHLNNYYNLVQTELFTRKTQPSIRLLDESKHSTPNYQTMNGAALLLTSRSGGKELFSVLWVYNHIIWGKKQVFRLRCLKYKQINKESKITQPEKFKSG